MKNLIDYIPKKYRKHIIDIYKNENGSGKYKWTAYHVELEWEDGFERSITEETISDMIWAVKKLENDREAIW